MGVQEWLWGKAKKALNEISPQEENSNLVQNDEVEKASYSPYSYKNVQRLREKGKYWAIDVPYLQHPVQKQEKPRPIFIVFGILYAVALVAALVFSVVVVINVLIPLIAQALQLNLYAKIRYWDIFGLFALFGSMLPIVAWTVVILVAMVIIGVNVFLACQTRKMFCLSKLSMQEMAKGHEIGSMLLRLVALIVITLVVGIAILVMTREKIKPAGIALVVGVMVVVCAVVGTIFGLLLAQRKKAKKQFEELSEEEQKDFIRHNQALDRVSSRRKKSKDLFSSSKVDF